MTKSGGKNRLHFSIIFRTVLRLSRWFFFARRMAQRKFPDAHTYTSARSWQFYESFVVHHRKRGYYVLRLLHLYQWQMAMRHIPVRPFGQRSYSPLRRHYDLICRTGSDTRKSKSRQEDWDVDASIRYRALWQPLGNFLYRPGSRGHRAFLLPELFRSTRTHFSFAYYHWKGQGWPLYRITRQDLAILRYSDFKDLWSRERTLDLRRVLAGRANADLALGSCSFRRV